MATLNDRAYSFYSDEASPLFKAGRTFRSFKKLNIPGNSTYVVKIVLPSPVYFTKFDLSVASSTLDVETVSGGTEGGTFNDSWPLIKLNLTKPTPYAVQTSLVGGGTHTGGTVIDYSGVKTDGNATRGSSIIERDESIRGVAAGTYYWRFINRTADVLTGSVKVEWEEPIL